MSGSRRVTIFAHRGASAHAPENTLAAFQAAVEMGADAIELDAKLAVDGQVVVIHDQTTDRTTGAPGRVIAMTSTELRRLDAGSHFAPAFRGERIPLLEEVFDLARGRLLVNVELTNYASPSDALPDRVAELVRRCGVEDGVLFSSFHPMNLVRIHRLLPSAPVALLALGGLAGAWANTILADWVPQTAFHPYFTSVNASMIRRQHRKKRAVNVWTVNDPAEMRRLASLGVDGLITDDPLLARKTLEAMN